MQGRRVTPGSHLQCVRRPLGALCQTIIGTMAFDSVEGRADNWIRTQGTLALFELRVPQYGVVVSNSIFHPVDLVKKDSFRHFSFSKKCLSHCAETTNFVRKRTNSDFT